jgi:HAD superfamily hydrolase (TIGR01509 family)
VTSQPLRSPLALIFDLDGVLIDSEPLHKQAKEQAFAEFGIVLSEEVYDRYKGRPDETTLREILEEQGSPEILPELTRRKREFFQRIEHRVQPVAGAVDFVLWAKSRFRIALATSSTPRNRNMAFQLLGIGDRFDAVVDSSRHQRPKPDPEVFQVAMNDLGLDAADCWIIEDSVNGVRAAKSAGCLAVGLTTTFDAATLSAAGVDATVDSFAELRNMLEVAIDGRHHSVP